MIVKNNTHHVFPRSIENSIFVMSANTMKICLYIDNSVVVNRSGSDPRKSIDNLNMQRSKLAEIKALQQAKWKDNTLILRVESMPKGIAIAKKIVRDLMVSNRNKVYSSPVLGCYVGDSFIPYEIMAQVFRDFSSREEIYVDDPPAELDVIIRCVLEGKNIHEGGFLCDIHPDLAKEVDTTYSRIAKIPQDVYLKTGDRVKYFVAVPKSVNNYGYILKDGGTYTIAMTEETRITRILKSQSHPIVVWSALVDFRGKQEEKDFINADCNPVRLIEEIYLKASQLGVTHAFSPDIPDICPYAASIKPGTNGDLTTFGNVPLSPIVKAPAVKESVTSHVTASPSPSYTQNETASQIASQLLSDQLTVLSKAVSTVQADVRHIKSKLPTNSKETVSPFKSLPDISH